MLPIDLVVWHKPQVLLEQKMPVYMKIKELQTDGTWARVLYQL